MEIKLENDIILFSDENQFSLRKETTADKDGKMKFRTIGYYSTLEQVLDGYVKYATRLSNATTLEELKQDLKEISEYIKTLKIDIKEE